jgi:hypothetical protein
MSDEITGTDLDPAEADNAREDYHRRSMGELRSSVTRGATGIETSYFLEQGALLSSAREGY